MQVSSEEIRSIVGDVVEPLKEDMSDLKVDLRDLTTQFKDDIKDLTTQFNTLNTKVDVGYAKLEVSKKFISIAVYVLMALSGLGNVKGVKDLFKDVFISSGSPSLIHDASAADGHVDGVGGSFEQQVRSQE